MLEKLPPKYDDEQEKELRAKQKRYAKDRCNANLIGFAACLLLAGTIAAAWLSDSLSLFLTLWAFAFAAAGSSWSIRTQVKSDEQSDARHAELMSALHKIQASPNAGTMRELEKVLDAIDHLKAESASQAVSVRISLSDLQEKVEKNGNRTIKDWLFG